MYLLYILFNYVSFNAQAFIFYLSIFSYKLITIIQFKVLNPNTVLVKHIHKIKYTKLMPLWVLFLSWPLPHKLCWPIRLDLQPGSAHGYLYFHVERNCFWFDLNHMQSATPPTWQLVKQSIPCFSTDPYPLVWFLCFNTWILFFKLSFHPNTNPF